MVIEEEPKKRKLNRWQLFLKDCSPRQDKSLGMTEKVSVCSIEYKQLKDNNVKKLDEIIDKVQKTQKVIK